MEQMSQELNINNYDIVKIKKLYNHCCNTNHFLNTFTLMDVEEGKKKVYLELSKKYDHRNMDYIEKFVNDTSNKLTNELFSVNKNDNKNTQMVGIQNIIKDPKKMNETYFNERFRIINIDSTYRENIVNQTTNNVYDSITSTNMFVNLNDDLDDVVQLELTNISIPFTFYNIDSSYKNNYFYVQQGDDISKVEISGGNYTNSTLIQEINNNLVDLNIDLSFTINTTNNKVKIENKNGLLDYNVIFYDYLDNTFSDEYKSHSTATNQSKLNNNLGWTLGFRQIDTSNVSIEYIIAASSSITSESLCYISHTKYFLVVLDDLNKNQTNKGLVQVGNKNNFIKPTQYFKEIDNKLKCLTDNKFNDYCDPNNRIDEHGNRLTKNQLYSALQINNHKKSLNEINSKLDADLINNAFAIIPFENKSLNWGESMIISDKNKYKRKYSGPVSITKMNIKLLDDKGNIINLNGGEWSFSMISTHLYQY